MEGPITQAYKARDAYIKEHGVFPKRLRCGSAFMRQAVLLTPNQDANPIPAQYLENCEGYAAGMSWEVDEALKPEEFILSH